MKRKQYHYILFAFIYLLFIFQLTSCNNDSIVESTHTVAEEETKQTDQDADLEINSGILYKIDDTSISDFNLELPDNIEQIVFSLKDSNAFFVRIEVTNSNVPVGEFKYRISDVDSDMSTVMYDLGQELVIEKNTETARYGIVNPKDLGLPINISFTIYLDDGNKIERAFGFNGTSVAIAY